MQIALSDCMRPIRSPIRLDDACEYRQVTVSLNGRGVSLRKKALGSEIKTKNQFCVRAGHFIYSRIDARNGAMGIVPPELDGAIVTGDFPVFEVDERKLDLTYLSYLARSRAFIETCRQASRGVTNRKRMKQGELLSVSQQLPSITAQKRVAARLSRIERNAISAHLLCEQLSQDHADLLHSIVSIISNNSPRLALKIVAPIIRRKVDVDKNAEYPELGIRSFGKGTFHKPAITGDKLGSKRIYRIESGDLLFSNVFAWEGAIAIAQPEDKGRFGSHRFITCLPDPSKVLAEYLRTWFLSAEGMAEIRAASPGAAGRNKTLSLKKLQAIQVPIPDMAKQRRFAEVYLRVQAAIKLNAQTAAELKAIMPAALDIAFRRGME